jgi:hypothetical protein
MPNLVSNSLYFALVGAVPADRSIASGAGIGLAASLGAVTLPPRLGLTAEPTNRSTFTQASTVALYTRGVAAGYAQRALLGKTDRTDEFFSGKHIVVTGGSRPRLRCGQNSAASRRTSHHLWTLE